MNAEELKLRWDVYTSMGVDPMERLWDTIIGPLYGIKEQHRDLLRVLRQKAEENPVVREAFREEFLRHFGFVPGEPHTNE